MYKRQIEGLSIINYELSSPHTMRIDNFGITLDLVSYKPVRNGKNANDNWELKIDGTLWQDLPVRQLPAPKRTLFRERTIRHFPDNERLLFTDFIFRQIRERFGVRVSFDQALNKACMQATNDSKFVLNDQGLLFQAEKDSLFCVEGDGELG